MAVGCFWGSKDSDDMIRQCLTACHSPNVRMVVTDEWCAECPYRATGKLSETLSEALAEYRKKHDVRYPESIVVILGRAKLTELLAENKGVIALNYPTLHHQFENYDILYSHELNEVTIAIRNVRKDKEKFYKEKEVKLCPRPWHEHSFSLRV